jgi:hypothetical protein
MSQQEDLELAASCWAFYSALLEQGFDAAQALKVTIAWVTSMMSRAQGDGDA